MSLQQLTDQDLNSKIKSLAQEERAILHSVLIHIKEADRRKLYLTLAYPNLYTYLTQGCGYSEGGAQRRIDAARLMQAVPEVGEKIERGELNLTQVGLIQKGIRQKYKQSKQKIPTCEKEKLVQRVLSRPTAEAQVIVAQALDLPIIQNTKETFQKDQSVTLQMTFTKAQWEKMIQMRELLSTATHSNAWSEVFEYVADKVIKQKRGSVNTHSESVDKKSGSGDKKNGPLDKKIRVEKDEKILSEKRNGEITSKEKIGIITSKEKVGNLTGEEKIGNITSKKTVGRITIEKIEMIENMANEKNDNNNNNTFPFTATAAVKRKNLAANTRRKVFQRDQSCQYTDKTTGKVCQSKWDLQIDHQKPLWAGGSDDETNLQVLCGRHNRLKYLKETNRRHV